MIAWGRRAEASAKAFTLIELLAVLVVLGMAVSVAAVGLSSRSVEAQLSDAASSMASLDASARVLARKGHVTELQYDKSDGRLQLIDRCCDDAVVIGREISATITLEAWEQPTGTPIESIIVDSRGQSVDYQVRVSSGELSMALTFAGLTGWYETTRSAR
jgi:prepilin-type N-terminal cleavage/methylation domain-containing protein